MVIVDVLKLILSIGLAYLAGRLVAKIKLPAILG